MRERFHHASFGVSPPSKIDAIKEKLFVKQLASPSLLRSFTIDELLKPYLFKKGTPNADKIVFCAEPIDMAREVSRDKARRQLGIRLDQRVLLLYGHVDERKGLDRAIRAVAALPNQIALLVAGRHDAWAEREIAGEVAGRLRKDGRLYSFDDYLDGNTEQACFAACDAAWLGYRGHYSSSGVLTQAAVVGMPIVSCREGLLGYRTKNDNLGLVVDIDDTEATAKAVKDCLLMDEKGRRGLAERADVLRELHSPETFAKVIYTELLGARVSC